MVVIHIKYIPAPVSLARMCSDMVIFDELDAVRSEEYRTQHIQMTSPTILWLSKVLVDFNPTTPRKPGLHFSSKKHHNKLKIIRVSLVAD